MPRHAGGDAAVDCSQFLGCLFPSYLPTPHAIGIFLVISPFGQLAPHPDMDFVTENGTQWAVKVSATDQSEQFLKLKQIAEEHGVGQSLLILLLLLYVILPILILFSFIICAVPHHWAGRQPSRLLPS